MRIREARKGAGYSAPERFAVALGISAATLSRWERGLGEPSVSRLTEIAALTKRPLAFFFSRNGVTGENGYEDARLAERERA